MSTFRCGQCDEKFDTWAQVRQHKREAAAAGDTRCQNALIIRITPPVPPYEGFGE